MIGDLDAAIRLLLAMALGAVVGIERQSRRKSAGFRTHILVSMGSCLLMILSNNLYIGVQGLTNADPARLAAQVVSGIGFLGAGTIMKEGSTVVGLTTAASLWVVAAIGLAAGSGYIGCALITTAFSYVTLTWLSTFEKACVGRAETCLLVTSKAYPGQTSKIVSYLENNNIHIRDIRVLDREECHSEEVSLLIHLRGKCSGELAAAISELDGVVEIKCEP